MLPPDGQLSPEQISQYTLRAYETAYNDGKFDREKYNQAEKYLGKVIDAVVNSIFEEKKLGYEYPGYDEYFALARTAKEYLEDRKLSGEVLDGLKEFIRKDTKVLSDKDKDAASKALKKFYITQNLGRPRGQLA